jgi:hypothetical protein
MRKNARDSGDAAETQGPVPPLPADINRERRDGDIAMAPSRARCIVLVAAAWFLVHSPLAAWAQVAERAEVGADAVVLRIGELDVTDGGVGARAAWRLGETLALDGRVVWFPGGDARGRAARQTRVLGLAGPRLTVAWRGLEVGGYARPGFLRFVREGQTVCIAIFPTPLACQLAAGYTAFALDLGGTAAAPLDQSGRVRFRVEIGDLLVRYGLTAFRADGTTTDGFTGHNFMAGVGMAFRF